MLYGYVSTSLRGRFCSTFPKLLAFIITILHRCVTAFLRVRFVRPSLVYLHSQLWITILYRFLSTFLQVRICSTFRKLLKLPTTMLYRCVSVFFTSRVFFSTFRQFLHSQLQRHIGVSLPSYKSGYAQPSLELFHSRITMSYRCISACACHVLFDLP